MKMSVYGILIIIAFNLIAYFDVFANEVELQKMNQLDKINTGSDDAYSTKKFQKKIKNGNNEDYYLIISDRLIVKDLPYNYSKVIGTLARGDTIYSIGFITVQDEFELISKFIKINFKGQVGYVDAKFTEHVEKIESEYSNVGPPIDKVSVYAGLSFLVLVLLIGTLDQ